MTEEIYADLQKVLNSILSSCKTEDEIEDERMNVIRLFDIAAEDWRKKAGIRREFPNDLYTIGKPYVTKNGIKGKAYISSWTNGILAFRSKEEAIEFLKGYGCDENKMKEFNITIERWIDGYMGGNRHIIVDKNGVIEETKNSRGTNFDDLYNDPNFVSPEQRERIEAEVKKILDNKEGLAKQP